MDVEEELRELDYKVKQLRLDYERYFLGARPRAPSLLDGEVARKIVVFSNTAIRNTALRFKLNSIVSRYQAFKRQWEETQRKMDAGTYERHRFKAQLHHGSRGAGETDPADGEPGLFERYRDARLARGQGVKKLTREKLEALLDRQRARLAERFGPHARFRFRVAVEDGRAKLKASRIQEDG